MSKAAKVAIPRFPITDEQARKVRILSGVTCLPGSFDKRFIRDMQGVTELTEKQAALVEKMVHRYRRQLGGKP